MAKKAYSSPIFFGLTPGDDPGIVLPPSQTTSGYDPYEFKGIDEDTLYLIELNCDHYDLEDMDTDGDYVITMAEFQAWYDAHEPW